MLQKDNQPQVCVIMPSFNREGLIGESIESVKAQSMSRWQLIIIDDGSTDETVRVAEQYAVQDTRIKVLKRTLLPKGPATCRNMGIEACAAPYCLFLDSDDLLAPHCLENRLKAAQQSPQAAMSVFQMQFFYDHPGDTDQLFFYADPDDALGSSLVQGSPWGISCPLWRTEVLRTLQGFDVNLPSWEDWDLHIRAFMLGYSYELHAAVDCYCRQGRVSLTSQHQRLDHMQRRTSMYIKLGHLLQKQSLPRTYADRLAGKCLGHCGQLYELGGYQAATEAWGNFKKAGIISGWNSAIGEAYLALRRTIARDNSQWTTRLLRKSFAIVSPKYFIWSY